MECPGDATIRGCSNHAPAYILLIRGWSGGATSDKAQLRLLPSAARPHEVKIRGAATGQIGAEAEFQQVNMTG